jgi:predicted kinase
MLVVFGGLPGTGKTTIAQQVAQRCGATNLRIDTIEQAIRSADALMDSNSPAGYVVAYALAEANLRFGQVVVADSVNPLSATRAAWRSAAQSALSPIIEIEIICSDPVEHRRRVEGRTIDVPGLTPPTWAEIQAAVMAGEYQPWPGAHLVVDTARVPAAEAVATIVAEMEQRSSESAKSR